MYCSWILSNIQVTPNFWKNHIRGVFRNNVDFFNNFAMLCSMVIKIILICFLILLPSFPRVWLGSDDFAQSYRLSKRVTNMNPAHVKDDVNEVAIFWLMHFAFRAHFLTKYSPLPHKKGNGLLVSMYSSFVHILILSLITICNNASSLHTGGQLSMQCQHCLCNVWFPPSTRVV